MSFTIKICWQGAVFTQEIIPRSKIRELLLLFFDEHGYEPDIKRVFRSELGLFSGNGTELNLNSSTSYLATYPATEVFVIRPAVLHA